MYKGVAKSHVQLSVSHDHKGTVSTRSVPYTQVVTGDFIFVPNTDYDGEIIERMSHAKETLSSLNLNVSTGKVVGSALVRFFLRINLLVLCLSFMLPIYLMDK